MQTRCSRRVLVAALSIVACAAVAIAGAMLSPAESITSPPPAATVAAPAAMVGVATGELANGVPVYRLPAITVAVSRSEALAQIAKEERLAQK